MTPGKLAGMKAVSNERGVIAAAAMDQRGSLKKSLAKEKGADVSDREMEEFKALVTEVLTRHASAILLDPEWGLPASKRRAPGSGLLLAYEKTGYDANTPGRLPDLLDEWSVRRLKEAGADCLKILLYYTPFDTKAINDHKHAWVERIGDECRANDIPFFLEFVGYEDGADEKGLDYAKKKPEIVIGAMKEFTKDRYGVDVMKVEVPINMKYVEGAKVSGGQKAYRRRKPWITSAAPLMCPPNPSSTFRPASAIPSSPKRSNSPPRRGRNSPAFCAAVRHGRTESRFTANRAGQRSGRGSKPRVLTTSTTSTNGSKRRTRGMRSTARKPPTHSPDESGTGALLRGSSPVHQLTFRPRAPPQAVDVHFHADDKHEEDDPELADQWRESRDSGGKRRASSDGQTAPSSDGPRRMPAHISPITAV